MACGLLNKLGVRTPLFRREYVDYVSFMVCDACKRIVPHWDASMTEKEAKARGYIGCKCGNIRMRPTIIPWYQSAWWMLVRGWLIRKQILHKRLWDPRVPILFKELAK